MRRVIYHAPRDIRLEEAPLPKPGPGEVVVKIAAALTCATDFKAYRQGHKLLLPAPPEPFGHEFSGTIAEAGAGVKGFKAGDRVVAGNSAPCDDCFFCARGQSELCDNLRLHNGGYAEYDLIPAGIVRHKLFKLPKALSFQDAALAEPLAAAVHGAEALNVAAGESVAILGAGPMALLLTQALAARKARVLVIGRGKENLERARRAGAAESFSTLEGDAVAAVRKATRGRGPDCVYEAVGRPETWQQAVALARKGGRVCLFGGCAPGTMVPLDAHRIHYEQLTLAGVFHHSPSHFSAAVELLAAGKIDTSLLVEGQISLAELPSYFERMSDKPGPKVAVLP